ncbi:LAFE_0F00540g1_1 [Lachancea fermentati]|uniref:LAFE_0F00540g1_1 n=1 Tax=Lachancea fermentati TaxID=4955 RepID=A0A1G4ME20_LACFM|nr:LAFE_0F00540g1_1 [Lachancea fermentati]
MTDAVSVAVGCAVGIPCGVAIVVALLFWYRMQRRFKKEREEDNESMNDDGEISFNNLVLTQRRGAEKEPDVNHVVAGSGSSEDTTNQEEKIVDNTRGGEVQRSRSKYTPAYRKKLNSSLSTYHQTRSSEDFKSANNSSSASLDTRQNLTNPSTMYDQIIPMLPQDQSGLESPSDISLSNEQVASNENLIKNLQNQDFGSYPRRKPSINSAITGQANFSSTSVHTRSSSIHSNSKKSAENVFETPKSQKIIMHDDDSGDDKKSSVYMLKNNYDVGNAAEIAEEDQYENEFTNYTESKREFIDSLRPRKL